METKKRLRDITSRRRSSLLQCPTQVLGAAEYSIDYFILTNLKGFNKSQNRDSNLIKSVDRKGEGGTLAVNKANYIQAIQIVKSNGLLYLREAAHRTNNKTYAHPLRNHRGIVSRYRLQRQV